MVEVLTFMASLVLVVLVIIIGVIIMVATVGTMILFVWWLRNTLQLVLNSQAFVEDEVRGDIRERLIISKYADVLSQYSPEEWHIAMEYALGKIEFNRALAEQDKPMYAQEQSIEDQVRGSILKSMEYEPLSH